MRIECPAQFRYDPPLYPDSRAAKGLLPLAALLFEQKGLDKFFHPLIMMDKLSSISAATAFLTIREISCILDTIKQKDARSGTARTEKEAAMCNWSRAEICRG